MAVIFKVLAIFVVLARVNGDFGDCHVPSSIQVQQEATGKQVEGKAEYTVSIFHNCPETCIFKNVKLNCNGFQTVEQINPEILSVSSDTCLVNNGGPVLAKPALTFSYAWDQQFPLTPLSSDLQCTGT